MKTWLVALWRKSTWREFALLFCAAGFCLCLWGFVELAEDVPEGRFKVTDEKILRAFRSPDDLAKTIGPVWLRDAGRDLTALGGPTVLTLLVLLVIGYLLLNRQRRAALFLVACIGGGCAVAAVLKHVIGRERPHVVPHLAEATSTSFPSGHSMLSSVVYLTLGALIARTMAHRHEKIYFILAALLLSFLVGVSRVFLGVHFPTDVLGGWAAGTGWALLCWMATYWLQRRGALDAPPPPLGDTEEE
jgi:undecaprenyl-diphosphatase